MRPACVNADCAIADVTRITLYLLLPICVVYTIFLIGSGVPQTLAGVVDVTTLEGARQQLIIGPVASLETIKHIGTNGGGFFGGRRRGGCRRHGENRLSVRVRRRPRGLRGRADVVERRVYARERCEQRARHSHLQVASRLERERR